MSNINVPGVRATATLDPSGLVRGVAAAQQALTTLEPVVARQWWGLQNLSRAFGAVGAVVTASFAMAVREASVWEDGMIGVQRTTGATAKEMEEIEKGLRGVARTTPIAASELANLAEQAGALGILTPDIPEFTRIMAVLIASTNLTEASVEDLGRTMNVLQVPSESFERFAATLLDVGRNTASTETDIINLSRRIAPMATAAGFTADEVLGLAAAISSMGVRAEAGASAMLRTFGDINVAVGRGGDELENWAEVADMSGKKFAKAWRSDASGALEQVIVGLGKFEDDAVGLSQTLDHLGQANVRNIITLGALAGGISDVNNEQTSLIAINKLAEDAWRSNTAMADVAARRAKSLSSQLMILRNMVSEAANSVGKAMLPALKIAVGVIQDLAAGFELMPGPVQAVFAGLLGVIGILSLMAAGILALIGPMVLMYQTWKTMRGVFLEGKSAADAATNGVGGLTRHLAAQVGTANAATGALAGYNATANATGRIQNRNVNGTFAKGFTEVDATSTAAATGGLARFWGILGKIGKVTAVVSAVLGIATIVMGILGNRARKNAESTEDLVEANIALVDAIDDQIRTGSAAADNLVLQGIAMEGLTEAANDLAGGLANVVQIIKGVADADVAAATVESLKEAAEQGDESAAKLLDYMAVQHAIYRESLAASGHLKSAREDLGHATEEAAEAERKLAEDTDKAREAQEEANDALLGYVDAVFAQRRATMSLRDAQNQYAEASHDAKNPTLALAVAENELLQARQSHQKALRDVDAAERKLATARKDQMDDLRDAESDVLDARDSYIDSVERVEDAERKLAELRRGPEIHEITDATNKLADAHLRLRNAEQAVEDAEWQLAYLRGEGASARAIEDAELSLDEARQDVLNATDNIGDAERELDELRQGATAEELAEAERDLERARRASKEALREISEREQAVRDLRREIAADTAYKDAQADLAVAHGRVHDGLTKIRDAELELQRIRSGGLNDELAKAQLDLEQALYDVATANVEVKKQQALARGEYWDSGRQAHALADELSALAGAAPSADAKKRLQDYISVLRQAKPQARPVEDEGQGPPSPKQTGAPEGAARDFGKMFDDVDTKEVEEKGSSIFEGIFRTIASLVAGRFIGMFLVTVLSGFGLLLGGWAALLIGLIAGFLIDKFLRSEIGQKMIDGLIEGLKTAAEGIGRFLHWLWFDVIWAGIKKLFGISSPSTKMAEVGRWLIEGLVGGLVSAVTGLAKWLGGLFAKFIGWLFSTPPGRWLLEKGKDIFNGLKAGLEWVFGGGLTNFLSSIPGKILGFFGNAIGWLGNVGGDVIRGLWSGIAAIWNWVGENFKPFKWITGFFSNAAGWLVSAGKNIIVGLVNGIAKVVRYIPFVGNDIADKMIKSVNSALGVKSPSRVFAEIGANVVRGFVNGIEGNVSMVEKATQKMLDAASAPDALFYEDVMSQFDNNRYRDFASAQLGGSQPSATTNNNGDTFNIDNIEKADPIEVAEEIMFKKMVRSRG